MVVTAQQRASVFGQPGRVERVNVTTPWGVREEVHLPHAHVLHAGMLGGSGGPWFVPSPLPRMVEGRHHTSTHQRGTVLGEGQGRCALRVLAVAGHDAHGLRPGSTQRQIARFASDGVGTGERSSDPAEVDDRPSLREPALLQSRAPEVGDPAGEHPPQLWSIVAERPKDALSAGSSTRRHQEQGSAVLQDVQPGSRT